MPELFKKHQPFLILLFSLTIIRFIYVLFVGITPQEAYYWYYSLKPALSYFDHPPMATYSIWLTTSIFGKSVFAVKSAAIIWSFFTNILLYITLLRMPGSSTAEDKKTTAFYGTILFNLTIFAHLYATTIVPDTPLLFFWLLIIFLVQEYLITEKPYLLLLAGVSLGLGLMSKYTAIAIVPGLFVFFLLDKKHRKVLQQPYIYLALIIAFVVFSGVIYWNATHDWASFKFQFAKRSTATKSFKTKYFTQLIGSQLFILTPYVFTLFMMSTKKIIQKWRETGHERLYLLTGIFIMGGFILYSSRSLVKMNWLLPGYLGLTILTVLFFNATTLFRKTGSKIGIAFSIILILAAHVLTAIPNIPLGEANTWSGWQDAAPKIKALQDANGGEENCFIFSNSYKGASLIKFYIDDGQPIYAQNIFNKPALQFDIWGLPDNLTGKTALYVFDDRKEYKKATKTVSRYFKTFELLETFEYSFNGKHTRTIFCYKGTGYAHPNN